MTQVGAPSSPLGDAPWYSTLTSPEFDAIAATALATILARQEALGDDVQPERFDQWSCDQDEGVLRFTNADGTGIEAAVQFLGSFSTTARSWEWAWNNPHVNASIARDSQAVRAHGEARGYQVLTTGILRATEEECRLMIGVAGVVAGGEGVFWGAAGPLIVAMGYRDIRRISDTVAPRVLGSVNRAAPDATRPRRMSVIEWAWRMVRDPLALKAVGPTPAGGRYVALPVTGDMAAAPTLVEYLTQCEQSLQRLGFAPPLRAVTKLSADIRSVVTLIEHPADGAIAFVVVGIGRHTGVSITASFRNDFADGILMYTSNSRSVMRTPSAGNTDSAVFPDVDDVASLYAIHRARVAERAQTVAIAVVSRGSDPLGFVDRETREGQAFWVRKGYYRMVDDARMELTWRGAMLSAWRGLFPWMHVTEREKARKRAAITRRLGLQA